MTKTLPDQLYYRQMVISNTFTQKMHPFFAVNFGPLPKFRLAPGFLFFSPAHTRLLKGPTVTWFIPAVRLQKSWERERAGHLEMKSSAVLQLKVWLAKKQLHKVPIIICFLVMLRRGYPSSMTTQRIGHVCTLERNWIAFFNPWRARWGLGKFRLFSPRFGRSLIDIWRLAGCRSPWLKHFQCPFILISNSWGHPAF